MNYSVLDKCNRIIRLFESGGGSAVTSVNGMTGDVIVKTFSPFPSSWVTSNATMNEFCRSISSTHPEAGTAYLGGIYRMNPMPPGFPSTGNIEVVVQVPVDGVYVLTATSTTTSPYHWEGTGDGTGFDGWKIVFTAAAPSENGTFTLKCVKNNNDINFTWVQE